MRPFDTAIAGSALFAETYLVGDFEDSLTERGVRVLAYEIEESEFHAWPFTDVDEAPCSCCGGSGRQLGDALGWAELLTPIEGSTS